MPGIAATSIVDLTNLTRAAQPNILQETQEFTAVPLVKLLLNSNRKSVSGGTGYQMNLRILDKTTARQVLPYEATSTIHEDLTAVQVTGWTHGEQKYEYDKRIIRMNQGGAQIVEYMKAQRSGAWANIWTKKERMLAGIKDSASDPLKYWGLAYWFRTLALNVADPTGSFSGKTAYYPDGTTETLRAGIDLNLARNARCPNFAGTYSGYVDEPFFDLYRRALTRTDFMVFPKLEGEAPAGSSASDCYSVASHDICDQWVKRINKGPDDQHGDTERFTDPQFRGVKTVRCPVLSEFAYNPVYGLKRNKVHGIVLGGEWLTETEPTNDASTLLTYVIGIHDTSNLTVDDCRSGGFVLHTVRTAA